MLKPVATLHCCPRASASTADESNVARTCGEEYIFPDSVDAGERAPHRAALPFGRERTDLLEDRRTHPGRKAPKKEARTGVRASWIRTRQTKPGTTSLDCTAGRARRQALRCCRVRR